MQRYVLAAEADMARSALMWHAAAAIGAAGCYIQLMWHAAAAIADVPCGSCHRPSRGCGTLKRHKLLRRAEAPWVASGCFGMQ